MGIGGEGPYIYICLRQGMESDGQGGMKVSYEVRCLGFSGGTKYETSRIMILIPETDCAGIGLRHLIYATAG